MTPKDATDEDLRAEAHAVNDRWLKDGRDYPTSQEEAELQLIECGIKRGQAIGRARVCKELRKDLDYHQQIQHGDSDYRDVQRGSAVEAYLQELLNEIEAA